MKLNLQGEHFLLEWFHDTEANGNSEMAYSVIFDVVAAFSFKTIV